MTPPVSDHFKGKLFSIPGHRRSVACSMCCGGSSPNLARWPDHVELTPQPPPPAPTDDASPTWGSTTQRFCCKHPAHRAPDPIFSERRQPLRWAGPVACITGVHSVLPKIDAVLLSHDHYDHWTCRRSAGWRAKFQPLFLAPWPPGAALRRWAKHIVELDWWESHALTRIVRSTYTARHWCRRSPAIPIAGCGRFLPAPRRPPVWFVGDSGYDEKLFVKSPAPRRT